MENCSKHHDYHYFLNFIDFHEHSIVNQGTLSFIKEHPKSCSAREWLSWAYDVCMDHDYACLFLCDVDGLGNLETCPVFSYHNDQGYVSFLSDFNCYPVVDPCFDEFDSFVDSYEAFVYAARVSTFPHPDIRFLVSELDEKYLKQEGDL